MAARVPTGPTGYIDTSAMLPREQVIFTGPDQTLNDQQFILDRNELVVSAVHRQIEIDWADAADWVTIHRHWVTYPDMCGSIVGGGTTIGGVFTVLLSCLNDAWEVRIYNTAMAAGYQFTTPVAGCTGIWCGASGAPGWTALTIKADGTENELALQVRCPAGVPYTDSLSIYGLGVYTGSA